MPRKSYRSRRVSRKRRGKSRYNVFMSKEIKRVKSQNPRLSHKAAFKKAASNWRG